MASWSGLNENRPACVSTNCFHPSAVPHEGAGARGTSRLRNAAFSSRSIVNPGPGVHPGFVPQAPAHTIAEMPTMARASVGQGRRRSADLTTRAACWPQAWRAQEIRADFLRVGGVAGSTFGHHQCVGDGDACVSLALREQWHGRNQQDSRGLYQTKRSDGSTARMHGRLWSIGV